MRATKAIVNLKAIRHNLSIVKQLAPKTQVMAVVKADAYGHGIVEVASALKDADLIAVACMDEAIKLRQAEIKSSIILLEGFFSDNELQQAIDYQLEIVIHHQQQLDAIKKLDLERASSDGLKIWLKMDSGMNRLGFDAESFANAYQILSQRRDVESLNLMSHLACADDITNPLSTQQIRRFRQAVSTMSGECSMANSAGVVAWPESHMAWVRPGIILYGCSPMLGFNGLSHGLKPAMTLRSQLFAMRELKVGDSVGYGATWHASQTTRIGVVAIGYGDGYPRHAKEGTPVLINGKKYPLVGQVSMDMITVDLGMDDQFELGCPATLWGEGLPVETVAEFADTIPYTLLCGVTSRVKFEWQP